MPDDEMLPLPPALQCIQELTGIPNDDLDGSDQVEENVPVDPGLDSDVLQQLQQYHDQSHLIGDESFKEGKIFSFDYEGHFDAAVAEIPTNSWFAEAASELIPDKGIKRKKLRLTRTTYDIWGLSTLHLASQKLYIALKWSPEGEHTYGDSTDANVRVFCLS